MLNAANVTTCVLALSVTLIRAADTYHKSVSTPVVTLLFLGCALWALPRQHRNVFLTGSALLVFAYVLDIALALVRGAQDGAYSTMAGSVGRIVVYLSVVALAMASLSSSRDVAERDRRLLAIVLAPLVYVVANGLLSIGGVQAPIPIGATAGERGTTSSSSQLLGLLGLGGGRRQFPLAASINLYSIVASAALAGLAVLRIRAPGRLPRKIAWPGMAICLFEILIGDSRATLAVACVVVLVFLVWRRFVGTSVVALLIPLFPLIVIGLLEVIGSTGIGAGLNRGGAGAGQNDLGSVTSGTGRVYIWRGAWQVLKHFRLQDVIGWGAAGQIPSGASLHYAFVFPQNNLAYTAFTHNLTLQVILDEGYLGLLILVAVLAQTIILLKRHLREEPTSPAIALAAMLFVFILSGATEVSPTYYSEEVLIMTLLVAGAAAGLAGSPRPSPPSPSPGEAQAQRSSTMSRRQPSQEVCV